MAKQCDRCGSKNMFTHHTSWYNSQVICDDCRKKEMARSDYDACRKAELEALRRGDLNFDFLPAWKEVQNG